MVDFIDPIQLPINLNYSAIAVDYTFFDLATAQLTASILPGPIENYDFHWNPVGAIVNDLFDPTIKGTLSNPDIYDPLFTADPEVYCASYIYYVSAFLKSNPSCEVSSTPIVINTPCKIGKPINPEQLNNTINLTMDAIGSKSEMQVYPNPSKGTGTIVLSNSEGLRDIELLDIKGAVVQQWKGISNNSIQLKNVQQGLYLLKVFSYGTGKVTTKKIIIYK